MKGVKLSIENLIGLPRKKSCCETSLLFYKKRGRLKSLNEQGLITSILKVVLDEWDSRPLEWKLKQLAYAKKFPENEYAQAIVAKAEEVPHPLGSVTTVTTVTTVTDKEDS